MIFVYWIIIARSECVQVHDEHLTPTQLLFSVNSASTDPCQTREIYIVEDEMRIFAHRKRSNEIENW